MPLGGGGPDFGAEVGPLVVKVNQPGSAQEGSQVVLQQVAVLPDESIQQPLVLVSKSARTQGLLQEFSITDTSKG